MTAAAFFLAFAQIIFVANLFGTLWRGRPAPADPWHAETPEWRRLQLGHESKRPALTGLLCALAASTMLFSAFVSAYVVRRGLSSDWTHLQLPWLLYTSLPLLLLVSAVLQTGRSIQWSAVFAALFFFLQIAVWRDAGSTSNPAGAFFYVLSGAFLLHVAGGIIGLFYAERKHSSIYWLFLNAVWIALLALFYFCG
jgi:Heme/copper-type cytochrome/quinol oxidase, subunit 3